VGTTLRRGGRAAASAPQLEIAKQPRSFASAITTARRLGTRRIGRMIPSEQRERIKQLCEKITQFLKHPEPGLFTWHLALSRLLEELNEEITKYLEGAKE
jgi:hypothetical protein